ncbi:Transmembrane and TPR repeat-containing protein CG4341 [Eumeta japonica]|uniref:Transmembrane and TPR repeat-containing protein CG4341 n=1 Tax=Eumeta variegata TaxID=151549 RepID=A0A4C1YUE3_EUMVA|nr:Transmembrane and TPR repeat-containing protein CG4341 [Eumeta japonica]
MRAHQSRRRRLRTSAAPENVKYTDQKINPGGAIRTFKRVHYLGGIGGADGAAGAPPAPNRPPRTVNLPYISMLMRVRADLSRALFAEIVVSGRIDDDARYEKCIHYVLKILFFSNEFRNINQVLLMNLFHMRAILTNPDVLGHTALRSLFDNDFWGTPLTDGGSHGSYRPLCVVTYRLNYVFAGLKPWSYHMVNVLLHCTATLLVVATARRLMPRRARAVGAAVAGLTFAAHPVHTEAVAGIVGRADLAACNLLLLSFLVYCEHLRLRGESDGRSTTYYKQKPVALIRRQNVSTACQDRKENFRLSCHRLLHHLATNVRKLLKMGSFGPGRLLSGIKQISYNDKAAALRPGRDYSAGQCSVLGSADENDFWQWMTLFGTLGLAFAATLCKEPAITILPVCIVYDFLRSAGETDSKNYKVEIGPRYTDIILIGAFKRRRRDGRLNQRSKAGF